MFEKLMQNNRFLSVIQYSAVCVIVFIAVLGNLNLWTSVVLFFSIIALMLSSWTQGHNDGYKMFEKYSDALSNELIRTLKEIESCLSQKSTLPPE